MDVELTILMPALNEEKTIEICIKKARKFIEQNKLNAEILIADNGSTDNTVKISEENGARVIFVEEKGYGNALINGIKNAKGKYVIFADSDDSYNFLELDEFLEKLRQGNEMVIGNRYGKNMEKGAMPFLHKYIGTPILSFIIRSKYKLKVKDINCGLRGIEKEKILKLDCQAGGMEYASEMIIKSQKAGLKITEVPINFNKDGRDRKPHLKTIRDGMRHLKIIFNN